MDHHRAKVLAAIRTAARAHVLPRFRHLAVGEVDQKSGFADLVTIADTEAEAAITAYLAQVWPKARVLGEEGVAADTRTRDLMGGAGWQVIVDPIDGTWNFAKGLSVFGMIAAVARDGLLDYGLLYDPLLDDWVEACDGRAWFTRADGTQVPARVSDVTEPALMTGYLPVGLFEGAQKRAAVLAGLDYGRVISLRCSCHEYRMLALGHAAFVLTGPEPHPWDHAAAVLIVQAAGGVARFLDGETYSLARRRGVLLLANCEATWARVAADFAGLQAE